mgnify:FL=1|tara:strand:+ start:186 stop:644 length:459 start_codon:yes stop_codon:yes gene_type:complete
MDKLSECPCCGSDACSISPLAPAIDAHLCWTCGFNTHTGMVDGSEFEKTTYESTAEIIKDLKQVHDSLAWYPKVINLQEKGMVFPEWNKRLQDWYWAAVNAVPVTEEEKEKYPDPANPGEFYKFRMDMKNIKRFDKLEFMDAVELIGLFDAE